MDNEAAFSNHCSHWFGFANDKSMLVICTWSHNCISKLGWLAVHNLLCPQKAKKTLPTSSLPHNP